MAVMLTPASRRIGRYELVSYLGSGGMSDVYLALHTGLRKRVALKLLQPSLRGDGAAVRRFLREGECAARVRHPNVVDVCDVGMHEGSPYLVMELLEGETLAQKLAREGPLELSAALDILLPIIDALAAVHESGVLHRDVKPANILLSRAVDGSLVPKLVDFGIALLPDAMPEAGPAVGPLGTPHYMSPEQARGAEIDERSDQFSLMSVFYETLAGREPFRGDTVESVLAQVARAKFPRLPAVRSPMPRELERVFARATARRPEDRYASMGELAHALVPFASARTRSSWVAREERAGVVSPPLFSGVFRAHARSGSRRIDLRVRRRSRLALALYVLAAALVLVGLGYAVVSRLTNTRELQRELLPTEAERMRVRSSPAALAKAASRALRVYPRDARIELDGVELGRGEAVLPPLDRAMHQLHVSAPGYVARVLLFHGALDDRVVRLDRARSE